MCNLAVNKKEISRKYHINFDEYFACALDNLTPLLKDGVVILSENRIEVPEHARIFIRAICARFDAYLNDNQGFNRYSRAI